MAVDVNTFKMVVECDIYLTLAFGNIMVEGVGIN